MTPVLLLAVLGFALRWAAYPARVQPPRAYPVTHWRWWIPPLALRTEFRTRAAWRLDVAGRVATWVLLAALVADAYLRHAA